MKSEMHAAESSTSTTSSAAPSDANGRVFTEHTLDAMFLHDAFGRVVDANAQACEHLGYPRHELIGMLPLDFDAKIDPAALAEIQRTILDQGSVCFETVHRRKDGTIVPVEVRMKGFVRDGRHLAVASALNITERRREEEVRRHQQTLLEESQSMAHLGSYEWSVASNTLTWSRELYRIYGVPFGEPLTLDSFIGRVHPDDRKMVMETIQQGLATGSHFAMNERIIRPDGEIRYLESKGRIIRDDSGQPLAVIGACLDVTEKLLAAIALRESEEHFRNLFASSNCAILEIDTCGKIVEINQAACQLLGYSASELPGRQLDALLHPEDLAAAQNQCLQLTLGSATQVRHSCRYLRKDATPVLVDVHLAVARRVNGRVTSLAVVAIDISAQKKLEEQIRETQKLEAVGRLAGGIAHDLNNLLTVINGYPDLLLPKFLSEDENSRAFRAIRTAGDRAARLSQQLLAFSRRAIIEPQIVRLNEIVQKAEPLLRQLLGEQNQLHTELSPDADCIRADEAQVEQILVNLVVNARDAMPDGGVVRIRSRRYQSESGKSNSASPLEWIELCVSDTGLGISEEVRARIFDPFFTTKEVGKGTGLGLAVVHGIVMQSDGRIEVDSVPGTGTTFIVSFPRSASMSEHEPEHGGPKGKARLTVLLVEDDDAVRQITRLTLEAAGHRVLDCSGGVEVGKIIEEGSLPFQLLITDVVMPELSGSKLCRNLRHRQPDLPVIFMSGFAADPDVKGMIDDRKTVFIQKPFTPATLIQVVEKMISASQE